MTRHYWFVSILVSRYASDANLALKALIIRSRIATAASSFARGHPPGCFLFDFVDETTLSESLVPECICEELKRGVGAYRRLVVFGSSFARSFGCGGF
jgi:hypothetical protein